MKKGIAVYIVFILITGCMSQGINPEERDRSGKFDGIWDATIDIEKQHQSFGEWAYTCPKQNFRLPMYIADGQMSSFQTKEGYGYIKEDGTFYVNEQHGVWGSTTEVEGEEMHFIFSGHLSEGRGKGEVVIAAGMRNYGCKGTLTLKKRGY